MCKIKGYKIIIKVCGEPNIFPFLEVKKNRNIEKQFDHLREKERKYLAKQKILFESKEKLLTKLWVQYTMFNTKMHLDMKLYSRSFSKICSIKGHKMNDSVVKVPMNKFYVT